MAHVRTASRPAAGAEIGSYHDGENDLADRLAGSFRPGILNLADRGFFSMDRYVRFAAAGSDLAWRVKDSARSIPARTLEVLPDGSELAVLHESDGMLARRRRESRNHAAPGYGHRRPAGLLHGPDPDPGREAEGIRIRVMTTLLDPTPTRPQSQRSTLRDGRWKSLSCI